jgi:outer membrane usher protein
VHAESQLDGASAAGLDTAWQVGNLGIVTLTAAAGGDEEIGWLGGFGFERSGEHFSVFAAHPYASEEFAQLGTGTLRDRPRQRSFGGVGFNFGRYGNLQLSYGMQSNWSSPRNETAGVSHSVTLGAFGYLGLIASHSLERGIGHRLLPELDAALRRAPLRLGERAPVARCRERRGVRGHRLGAAEPACRAPALATTCRCRRTKTCRPTTRSRADAGQVGVQFARRNETDGWRASASGGLAITAPGVMPSRQLDRSFAVVEVADLPGHDRVRREPADRPHRQQGTGAARLAARLREQCDQHRPAELPLDASLATPRDDA